LLKNRRTGLLAGHLLVVGKLPASKAGTPNRLSDLHPLALAAAVMQVTRAIL
jgi:hypothetical protein